MRPSEEVDHRRTHNAPVVTPLPLSVFEYLKQNLTRFDVGRFRRMPFDENELQVRARLRECHDTPFAE